MMVHYEKISSPFGEVGLVWMWRGDAPVVTRVLLPRRGRSLEDIARGQGFDLFRTAAPAIEDIIAKISRCLEGKPVAFSLDHLDMDACYAFQKRVLPAEAGIPRGRVSTYGALAQRIGSPRAARAVGTALARNPFPIIVPCHRAVRSDGSIGGFGGGPEMKRALLEMEGVRFDLKGRVKKECFF